jgi:hypothetical protein
VRGGGRSSLVSIIVRRVPRSPSGRARGRHGSPVKFYRPGETAPYFLVASAGAIAQFQALTPGQMFEVMLQDTSDRDRARLISSNSMTA